MTAVPSDSVVKSGTKVTLTCKTGSSGSVSYKFYKNHQEITDTSGGTYTVTSSVSTVRNSYTCTAAHGGATSAHSDEHKIRFLGEICLIAISIQLQLINL